MNTILCFSLVADLLTQPGHEHTEYAVLIISVTAALSVGLIVGLLAGHSKADGLAARLEMTEKIAEQTRTEGQSRLKEAKAEAASEMERQKAESEKMLAKQTAEHERQMLQLREDSVRDIEELKRGFDEQKSELKEQFQKAMDEKDRANSDNLKTQEQHHREVTESMQRRFDEIMEKVSAQMKSATDEMLKERQKEFGQVSRDNIEQIVDPLKETIANMKKAMEENTEKQTSMSSEMKTNIEHMMNQSRAAKESADELARLFKKGSKVQGDWGETILDELLQSQGLTKGVHYDTQTSIRDASGSVVQNDEGYRLRPDIILHLDQRRELIIDSKTSLSAFMDYVNSETEDERQKYLKLHVDSIKSHVKELSRKDYSSYVRAPKVKMDYVIMFVPHSGALWAALNAQPDLWRKAMEQNVFIADEQTLFAALRIIEMTWTQISQAQNHEKVYELANEMIQRVGQFLTRYKVLGEALEKAQKAYNDSSIKLNPHGQSIVHTAQKLVDLGARQSSKHALPQLTDIDNLPSLTATKQELSEEENNNG